MPYINAWLDGVGMRQMQPLDKAMVSVLPADVRAVRPLMKPNEAEEWLNDNEEEIRNVLLGAIYRIIFDMMVDQRKIAFHEPHKSLHEIMLAFEAKLYQDDEIAVYDWVRDPDGHNVMG